MKNKKYALRKVNNKVASVTVGLVTGLTLLATPSLVSATEPVINPNLENDNVEQVTPSETPDFLYGQEEISEGEAIPFETIYRNNPNIHESHSERIVQQGQSGIKMTTRVYKTLNGQRIELISQTTHVLSEPIPKIIEVPTGVSSTREDTETIEIPFETERVENPELEPGEEKVVQEGRMGKREIKTRYYLFNDEVTSSQVVSDTIIIEPVNKIIEYGVESKPEEEITTEEPSSDDEYEEPEQEDSTESSDNESSTDNTKEESTTEESSSDDELEETEQEDSTESSDNEPSTDNTKEESTTEESSSDDELEETEQEDSTESSDNESSTDNTKEESTIEEPSSNDELKETEQEKDSTESNDNESSTGNTKEESTTEEPSSNDELKETEQEKDSTESSDNELSTDNTEEESTTEEPSSNDELKETEQEKDSTESSDNELSTDNTEEESTTEEPSSVDNLEESEQEQDSTESSDNEPMSEKETKGQRLPDTSTLSWAFGLIGLSTIGTGGILNFLTRQKK